MSGIQIVPQVKWLYYLNNGHFPETHTVHYSDESGIQVFGIQMVIVYSGDLKSKLVWILNGRKGVGLQMVRSQWDLKSGSPTI